MKTAPYRLALLIALSFCVIAFFMYTQTAKAPETTLPSQTHTAPPTPQTPASVSTTTPVQTRTSSETSRPTQNTETVFLSIDDLYTRKPLALTSNETLLTLLQSLNATDPQLKLRIKEYSGLGTLVEAMGDKQNGTDKKYWQYTVNGVMPQMSADAYKPKQGDRIEWHFSKSTY